MKTIRNLEDAAFCRWKDCLFYGKPDEGGYLCDEKQVAMCEHIRAGGPRPDYHHYGDPGPVVFEKEVGS